jgi:hypothetical protein
MSYKLFLDDVRNPVHCITYMHLRIGKLNSIYLENEWVIARNFESFKNTIKEMGLPDFISFDHDLAVEHYRGDLSSPEAWEEYHMDDMREETGYDCAKWLVGYCMDNKKPLPKFTVHSMNPIGVERIMSLLKSAEKWTKNGKS